jgi:hypothetical protein
MEKIDGVYDAPVTVYLCCFLYGWVIATGTLKYHPLQSSCPFFGDAAWELFRGFGYAVCRLYVYDVLDNHPVFHRASAVP